MSSIGSITSTAQAVYSAVAAHKVVASSGPAPTRDADGDHDGDRSPPGSGSIWNAGKGAQIDLYA